MKSIKNDASNKYDYYKILISAVCILLFLPPFFRGFFFDYPEHMIYNIVVSIVFIAFLLWYWNNKKDDSLIRDKQELLQLVFILIYMINIIFGINKDGSTSVFLRLWIYLLIYWMVSRLFDNEKRINSLLWCIYVAGFILTVTPITTALGIYEFVSAFAGNRFQSTIQYANTYGIYMIVMSILGYYLYNISEKARIKAFVVASNALIFMGLVGSLSRGAWLIYPIIVLIYFIFSSSKMDYLYFYSFVWFGGAITYILSFVVFNEINDFLRLLIIIVVLLSTGVLYYLTNINELLRKRKSLLPVFLLVCFSIVIILKSDLIIAVLSSSLNRIINIDFSSVDALSRIAFWKDAIAMAFDRPLIGFGGQGWQAGYRAYQNHLYYTTEVHNHWLQVLVESGFIGFTVFASIWVLSFIKLYKTYIISENKEVKLLAVSLGCSLLALAMHSFLDFDFSIGSVYILFWVLIALTNGIYYHKEIEHENIKCFVKKGIVAPIIFITAIIMLLVTMSFSIANTQYIAAIEAENDGEFKKAEQYYNKVTTLNPLSSRYLSKFSEFYLNYGLQHNNNEITFVGLRKLEEANSYDRMNAILRFDLAKVYFSLNMLDKAVDEAEKAVQYQKMSINNYNNLMNMSLQAGIEFLKRGETEKAKKYFKLVIDTDKEMADVWSEVETDRKKIWDTIGFDKLIRIPRMSLYLAKASIALSEYDKVEEYLNEAKQKEEYRDQALLWQAIRYEKIGDTVNRDKILKELKNIDESIIKEYEEIIQILKI